MKRFVLAVFIAVWCAVPVAHAATQKGTQFRVRIVPLDCTIETIDYGDGPVQVVTCPEDPEPEPEPEPEPSPEPSPQEPTPDETPSATAEAPSASSRIIQNAEELEEIFDRVPGGLNYTLQIEESLQQTQNRYANTIIFGQMVTGFIVFGAAGLAIWQLLKLIRPDITIIPLIGHRYKRLKDIFWRRRR